MIRGAIAAALWAAGCAAVLPSPPAPAAIDPAAPARFDFVGRRIYRSAQPNRAQLAMLHEKYGVVRVIKLNGAEAIEPDVPGVEVISIPLSVAIEPSKAEADAIVGWIDKTLAAPEGAVLIHCTEGRDRTGWAVAAYGVRHGVPWRGALIDAIAHGMRPYGALWRAFAREAGW